MTAQGNVVSVNIGAEGTLEKAASDSIEFALDGIVGDRHRGIERECWDHDKQPEGTLRRNERQWSAVSQEELEQITRDMGLSQALTAEAVGANLCLSGIPDFSRLPRGTLLEFGSGVVLMVEEYNPPCSDMGESVAARHARLSGESVDAASFSNAAKFSRGIVGVVEVAGTVQVGDSVVANPERLPKWLRS